MKNLLLLFIVLNSVCLSAQTFTEKWNDLTRQYEYYNSQNQLVGYKKYNSLSGVWEYYEATPQVYRPQSNINAELTYQVLANKQARFNRNKQTIQKSIDGCYEIVDELEHLTYEQKQKIKARFSKEYVTQLQGTKIDLSVDANVNSIIDWLFDGIVKLCKQENN